MADSTAEYIKHSIERRMAYLEAFVQTQGVTRCTNEDIDRAARAEAELRGWMELSANLDVLAANLDVPATQKTITKSTGLNFGEAFIAMRAGKAVGRYGEGNLFSLRLDRMTLPPMIRHRDGSQWVFRWDDLFAEDWEILPNEREIRPDA